MVDELWGCGCYSCEWSFLVVFFLFGSLLHLFALQVSVDKCTDSEDPQLQEGEQHIVDNGHLVAWNCDYKIEKAASGSWSSVKSGEGLVSVAHRSLCIPAWLSVNIGLSLHRTRYHLHANSQPR